MIRYIIACWFPGEARELESLLTFGSLYGALTYFVETLKKYEGGMLRPLSTIQLYRPEAGMFHCVLSHDFPGSRAEE